MSHSSSRRKVLDSLLPLAHRFSHARSCVNHVANRLGVTREELLAQVHTNVSVDLTACTSEEDLLKALHYIEIM